MNKPFTNYDEQIKRLRDRGVNILSFQVQKVKKLLKRVGYYSIINGYKDIFLQYPSKRGVEDIYKVGTTFNSIYSLFTFDRNMRSIFMKNILIVEGIIKSHISYYFSQEYKSDFNYFNINNFNPDRINDTTRLLTKISSIIQADTSTKKGQIPHYLKEHKCLPLWVLMRKLDFGGVSYFYACINQNIRLKISNEVLTEYNREYSKNKITNYPNLEEQLESMLKFINLFRNVCAHEDRLFNLEYRDKKGNIPRIIFYHTTMPVNFTSKLYDLIIILKLFLTKKEFQIMVKEIENEWSELSKYLQQNTLNEVMIKAGFPKNWKDRL